MGFDSFKNQVDPWDIYKLHSEEVIISNRNIFDFSLVKVYGDKLIVVWSEYLLERDDKVNIYSYCYDNEKCQTSTIINEGNLDPNIRITVGKDCKIHLLLARSYGALTELLLKTYDGISWKPETKIIDIESATFGHGIIASQKREKLYITWGDYREWHTWPYIFTAVFTGHMGREFGKLSLIEGNGVSWNGPRRITRKGRFSVLNPSICLNDEMDILHIVWEDEKLGYWKRVIFLDSFKRNRFSGNKKISGKASGTIRPLITCDNKNNVYVLWGSLDESGGHGRLYFRERMNDSWGDVMELAQKGIGDSITTDNLGNIHFVWDDGSRIYYKIKTESSWTKTITFVGNKARLFVDDKNSVHLVMLRRQDERTYSLTYNELEYKKISV